MSGDYPSRLLSGKLVGDGASAEVNVDDVVTFAWYNLVAVLKRSQPALCAQKSPK